MFWKKHKSKEEFKETQWYMLRWYRNSKEIVHFDNVFNLINQCNLSVVGLRFYNGEIHDRSWDGLNFGLSGTLEQHAKFTELCYMNKQLEFFIVED